MKIRQLSFADIELGNNGKAGRISAKLDKIDAIVDWDRVLELVRVVGRTSAKTGGAPHRDILCKAEMLFLQHLYNLGDPELEDRADDRSGFQRFAGVPYTETVPDHTTIWRSGKPW